jgi:arginyl-tRNA synthetase
LTGEEILHDLREEAFLRAAESRADDKEVLADIIATAALKYQILRQAVGTDIVFDKAKALSFEGASGPYLQYTYARIGSTILKSHETGVSSSVAHAPVTPYALERILYRFPEVVATAAQAHEPHHIVTYLTELAGAFNTFYAHEKIADAADEFAPYKTALAEAVRATLGQGMHLLGFIAPEKM